MSPSPVKETSQEEEEEVSERNPGYLEGVLEVFNSNLDELSTLEDFPLSSEDSLWANQMVENIQSFISDLRFLKMSFLCGSTLDAEIIHILIPVNRFLHYMRKIPNRRYEIESMVLNLQDRIRICKRKFEQQCELVLHNSSLRCNNHVKDCSSTPEYLADILRNLKDLRKLKTGDEIQLLNNQIATLEEKVTLLHNLTLNFNEMRAFEVAVHDFARYSASLVFLYRVKDVDEDMATQLNLLLSNVLLHKYRPCVPAFKAVYIRFLEEMKSRQFHSFLSGQIVHSFVELLLENLTVHISKEEFRIIRETLFFVISFLFNPPDQHVEDQELMLLTAEMDLLVKQDLYHLLSVDDMDGDFSEANACLGDFARKAGLIKGRFQQVYERTCDSFSYDLQKINGVGFFDFLQQNLSFLSEKLKKDTNFIPFAKHLIIQIEEELMSLRPYLDDLFKLQKKDKELKDTWLNVMDLTYQTEYAVNSCSVAGDPLWYNMARLTEVLKKLKDANSSIKKVEGRKRHDGAILNYSAVASNRFPEGPSASSFNEVMVGVEEEAAKIIENLIYGSKSLEIVAIVGMPGLGKTTMANKVYNAPAVRNYFHVLAFCIVSQVYDTRKILLDILGEIKGKDDSMHEMMEADLADMLRKCLLGVRYLIVMDDIWDVKAWAQIESSFPNKQTGSRVIFTTRDKNVASLAKRDCIIHPLRFLFPEESWELMRKKAFQAEEDCPPDFLEVGKTIAKKCKGLPLKIVLIAGILRTERSLLWWNKISEEVSSYVSTDMSVLELSYQYLPEHLKPCFLYLGAFVEDKLIGVNKLTLLWIAEGFVLNSKRESLKKVADKYLRELVDKSLVITIERSSYGGIKSCRVHDLVLEFCQRKAQEENILQLMVGYKASTSSSSILRNPYRVCINMKGKYVSNATNICPSIHSLLVSCKWKIHCHDPYDLNNLKFVQVMDLEELDCDARFLREMQSVVHLRFMAISLSSKWSPPREFTLDNVISNWWNLEILILSGFSPGKFPEAIWNMTRLMHVYFNQCCVSISGVKKGDTYPHSQMLNLESFSSLSVSSTEDLEVFLQRSPSLRKLSFRSTDDSIHFPTLDSLSRLESLKVEHVGEACLRSFNLLSSLKKLSLTDCNLNWPAISVISELPCLEVLKLLEDSFVGPECDMDDTEFPKLTFLKLQDLDLVNWIVDGDPFPCLEVLIVDRCNKLNGIPPRFGEMQNLKMIKVNALHKVVASAVEIRESQHDLGNLELQVMIE